VQKNAKKMGVLIDNLLSFARLGKKELRKSEIDMNQLVASILADMGGSEDLNVDVKIQNLHPVQADRVLMTQVLTNLISNAIKYSSKQKNAEVEITSEKQDGEIIYSVQDNGVGFDMEYIDKLFGVFQRLHSQEEFTGTGVGLAIAKRIIQKHDGNIWAESRLGNGAKFYFSLPTD
jgi:light-regulated signal transduction histidine kinase (bacteriophytochrome)